MGIRTRRTTSKNPPIFSHEFIIQNHADIVSCIAMFLVVGLMFQVTAPLATSFVTLQHNVTVENATEAQPWIYNYGPKDIATIFFYSLICIVVHAVTQEYGIDKLQRRVHLSKTKTAKFSESGQLALFYGASAIWAGYIIVMENYASDITLLWKDYPVAHQAFGFGLKFFFIIQIAYWIHCYPELYFQKVKRDEINARLVYTTFYLITISAAYILNYTRVCVCILSLHYAAEFIFHLARLVHFTEKSSVAKTLWKVWNTAFVLVRLGCVTLAVLTFWYGLRLTESPHIDPSAGNFNTGFIRLNCLLSIFGLQGWSMWNFICAWLRRSRDASRASGTAASKTKYSLRSHQKKNKSRRAEDEVASLPESDQYDEELRRRNTPQKTN